MIVALLIGANVYSQDHVFNKTLRNAEAGDAKSQYWVGEYYLDGISGCQKSGVKALYWFVKCAKQGGYRYLPSDKCELASGVVVKMWEENRTILGENNYSTAFNLIKEGAEANIPEFQEILGECYFEGIGVSKDYSKAFYWYQKANNNLVHRNNPPIYSLSTSEHNIGVCYQKGLGTKVDYKKAMEYYSRISLSSFTSVIEIYNEVYSTNRYFDDEFFKCFKDNVFWLGGRYEYEYPLRGLAEIYAMIHYDQEKIVQCVRAMYYLGYAYEMGRGTEQDVEKSQQYYRKIIDIADKHNVQTYEINLARERLSGGYVPNPKPNQLASITFLSPTTSSTTTYTLRAGVKSSTQITSKSVSVNGTSIPRGLNVINNNGYDLEINQIISLNRGNNTITVSITNGSGTTSKSLNVYVSDNSTPPTEKRVALVIGNSNYPQAPLTNPVNDATDMAAKLRLLGFDVTLQTNLSHSGFDNALKSFKSKANYCDVALLYYAGHGMEIDGNNYLIPVDAPINDIDQLKYKSVDAYYALDILSGAKKKIIILDACRNNPSTRGALHGGLAAMNATNALIAYSTSPGKTAADGSGRNSPYTYALLNALNNKNLTLPQLFQMVAKNVSAQKTGQIPWYVSSLVEDVILNR